MKTRLVSLTLDASEVDVFISFRRGCVHTKWPLSKIFLSVSLPLDLPLVSSAVYFNKNSRLESESAVVQCLCNCIVRAATPKTLHMFKYLFFIQREKLLSADSSFVSWLCSFRFWSDFRFFPVNAAGMSCSKSKPNPRLFSCGPLSSPPAPVLTFFISSRFSGSKPQELCLFYIKPFLILHIFS